MQSYSILQIILNFFVTKIKILLMFCYLYLQAFIILAKIEYLRVQYRHVAQLVRASP